MRRVQAMLEAISLSQPQPKVPSELVQFVGKTYSAYHTAVPLLESHVSLFPHDARCFDALVGCLHPRPVADAYAASRSATSPPSR